MAHNRWRLWRVWGSTYYLGLAISYEDDTMGQLTNPRELLVACTQVRIRAIGCKPLPVVVEAENLFVRKWDAVDRVSPAIVAILVLVDVVTEMNDIVDRVLRMRYKYVLLVYIPLWN
jgi:hypothetical protein